MTIFTRRRGAMAAALGIALSSVVIGAGAQLAHAGSSTNDNACFTSATATYGLVPVAMTGTAAPNPVVVGNNITLTGSSVQATFSAALFLAGYRLGILNVGANNISATVNAAVAATNTTVPSQAFSFPVTVVVTIVDPTPASRSSGDESAQPLVVNQALPDSTWTTTGGTVTFTQGALSIDAIVGALAITLGPCNPTSGLTGCDATGNNCTGFTPAVPIAFDSVTVTAPPTAPVCTPFSAGVGAGQSQPIDLRPNCTDVNGDAITIAVGAVPAGGGSIAATATPGVFTYTAPAVDPGVPVVIPYTGTDPGGLVGSSTITINVLANQCDATTAQCSLTQIVVQPVVGTTMTMDKVPGQVVMSTVILNGQPQASSGALQNLTVTNARGTANGWTLTGFVTDLGAPGGPTITLPTGQTIPNCSPRQGLGGTPDRLCIPGDNLGWTPNAAIVHDIIAGDVAQVAAGPSHAASASDWLSQLIAAGAAGANGLGGLNEQNVLCSSPVNHSGGTFQCGAALYLGVPASAGAGIYGGGLVLTLV